MEVKDVYDRWREEDGWVYLNFVVDVIGKSTGY
jgi:uncharacterized protein YfiM (DUF2279 family)